jgi:hypothetical protein
MAKLKVAWAAVRTRLSLAAPDPKDLSADEFDRVMTALHEEAQLKQE